MRRDAPLNFLSGKQRYSVLVLTLFLVLNSFFSVNISFAAPADNSVVCDIFFMQPFFEYIKINNNTYTQIKMQDCVPFAASTGDPALPVYPAKILIPNGKKISDISVSNRPFVLIKNDLVAKPVVPQQEAFPFSVNANEKSFMKNESLYKSNNPVFENVFSIGDIGFCRGYEILTIYLYPIQYIPKDGLIYYTDKITITVNFEDDVLLSNSNSFFRGYEKDEPIVASIVENPSDIKTYSSGVSIPLAGDQILDYPGGLCDPSETYEYVIITSDSLKDTTGYDYNWSDLISHRQSYSGLSGIIVSVEEINSCSAYFNETALFNDTQARIREFCKDAYQNWNTEYILLAGDWDSDSNHQIVPYRLFTDRFETLDYDNMACDLYYSHLDGDWYHSDSGYWGGGVNSGVNDLYAELSVGRITVSNAEMVSNAVSKIIGYDTNISLSDSWLRTVSFWGGNLGWTATSKEYMEEIRLGTDTHRTFTGFEEFNVLYPDYDFNTSERLYHKDLGASYKTYFAQSVQEDVASIINHLDHSSWSTPFSLSTWDSISNTKPFFGFSQGCLAGRYQSAEAGCEKLICKYPDKHAFALVLNTGYGYGSGISTNGASQYMMAFFWDYFLGIQSDNQSDWQLGKAMAYAQDKMAAVIASSSSAWCYTWYSTHLFADPAQTLRLNTTYSNDPVSQSNPNPINGSIDVSIGITNLSITLSDGNDDLFNWYIQTSPDIGSSSGFSNTNGVKSCNISGLSYSTTYIWFVNASDGDVWSNKTYIFTTEAEPVNLAPEISNPSIENGSIDVFLSVSNLSVVINDPEGNLFNWIIQTSPDIGSNSGIAESNGTKICNVSNLVYGTTYTWFVNASDGNLWSNNTYFFTTQSEPVNLAPNIVSVNPVNSSVSQDLSFNWSVEIADPEGDSFNYTIECSNGQSVGLNNVTNATFNLPLSDLQYNTSYKVWVNVTEGFNYSKSWYIFTTKIMPVVNSAPVLSSQNPDNNSNGVSISTSSLQITINDPDGDFFNWSIQTSPDIGSSSGFNASNGSCSCSVSNLAYFTTYLWFVNVSDGNLWCNQSFVFSTQSKPKVPSTPSGASHVVSNAAPVASVGGQYSGFVNQSISFSGSSSYDSDGSIVSYNWIFGDEATGSGVSISHFYSSAGNYTVTLTVTDNNGATGTDTVVVFIQDNAKDFNSTINVSDFISDEDDDSVFVSSNTTLDEIKDFLNVSDDAKVEKLNSSFSSWYLIDSDNDGFFDVFYDYENGFSKNVKYIGGGDYLLDVNGDDIWDYKYNILSNILSAYSPVLEEDISEEFVIYPGLVFVIVLVVVFVLLLVFAKRHSSAYDVSMHSSFSKPHVNFFSKDKHIHVNVKKLNNKYNHVQSIYSKSDKSDIIYDSSLTSDIVSSLNKPVNTTPKVYDDKDVFDPVLDEIRSHVQDMVKVRSSNIKKFNEIDALVDDIISSKFKE